jgi:alkaline phosphatase
LGTIGVDGRAKRTNCSSSIGANVTSILDWAQQAGKKVGIITTARITHATPSAAYAHIAERNWEGYDTKYFGARQSQEGCVDIAHQLVLRSPPIDLLFGGGRRFFYPNTTPDVENPKFNGSRTDNRSLINEFWRGDFIWNKTAMDKIILGTPRPLMGLFDSDHMYYETDRIAEKNDQPSLSQMTKFAIEHFLNMNQNGFFLLIEGGRIDHGHHATKARYALDEFVEFDNTIGLAKQILKTKGFLDDTLLVVTADHSHVFTFGAYGSRGSNILGFASLEGANVSNIDKLPVNIIAYGNGPNFNSPRNATYFASLNTNLTNYLSPTALPLESESHGGDDVPVFAQGPWSHLFIGTMEQHTIAHKMAYAACWGAYTNRNGCPSIIKITTATVPFISNGVKLLNQFKVIKIMIIFLFYKQIFL